MAVDTSKSDLEAVGAYDLLAKIAEGGMGTVYKGRHRDSGQIVAIKIVPPNMARNPVFLKRFEQEFQAARMLDHPNIVKGIDYCGTGTTPFLVMEFVDGESLGQKLERERRIPEAESVRIIGQVCQGLHKAHKQGMIHRDVKPDNIMLTADGTAKLTDLGLVKDMDAELNLTRTGRGLGTPHFMAPEQFRNAKSADVRCDIYSLGATLYQMVTGELPFKSCGPLDAWMKKVHNEITPPRQIVPTLSERIDWAIRRSMNANPEERPASCREFVEDLTGHSTRKSTPNQQPADEDLWYLVYKDEDGETHTVKGSTEGIRRSLKEGLLGDGTTVRACRSKAGPFEPVRGFPEFRDLVVLPTPSKAAGTTPPTGVTLPQPTAGRTEPKSPGLVRPRGAAANIEDSGVPHIELVEPGSRQPLEWLMWAAVLAVAVATALVASFLLSR